VKLKLKLEILFRYSECILFLLIDAYRSLMHSAPLEKFGFLKVNSKKLESMLRKDIHRIEKGLSLEEPKKNFGVILVHRINQVLKNQNSKTIDPKLIEQSQLAKEALLLWNQHGVRGLESVVQKIEPPEFSQDKIDFVNFFSTRKSVRSFEDTSLDLDNIKFAVEMALNTPSVCNRQGWKMWFISDPDTVQQIRMLQNGNKGFTNLNNLLVFAVDRRLFSLGRERNQLWIDGGMFAMSVIWSLHSRGIASCFLNWAESPLKTKKLRNIMNIQKQYEIVTLCALGYPAKDSYAALSRKEELDSVFKVI